MEYLEALHLQGGLVHVHINLCADIKLEIVRHLQSKQMQNFKSLGISKGMRVY